MFNSPEADSEQFWSQISKLFAVNETVPLDSVLDPNPKLSYPKLDITDHSDHIEIEVHTPGLTKNDVSIEIFNGLLTISGQKQTEKKKEEVRYLHRELKRSSFKRSVKLNEFLDTQSISATFENGVLLISIKKLIHSIQPKEPRKIEIK